MRRWKIEYGEKNAVVNGSAKIFFDRIVDTAEGKELYLGGEKVAELGHEEVVT